MIDDWVVIVEPRPREEAAHALTAWLKEQAEQGNSISDSEIRQDVIWSNDREHLVRYAVRSKIVQ